MRPQRKMAGSVPARRRAAATGRARGRRCAMMALGGMVALAGIIAASAPQAQGSMAATSAPSTPPASSTPSDAPNGREALAALVRSEAERVGLPAGLAETLVAIDSDFDPGRVGPAGERGLMQIRLSTAMMLGFRGEADELDDPRVNVRYGVAHLHQAWRIADGDLCRALLKYRTHYGAERANARSNAYCEQARTALAAKGKTLGTAVASAGGDLPAGVTAFAPSPSAVTIIPPGSASGTPPATGSVTPSTTGNTARTRSPMTMERGSTESIGAPTSATRLPTMRSAGSSSSATAITA